MLVLVKQIAEETGWDKVVEMVRVIVAEEVMAANGIVTVEDKMIGKKVTGVALAGIHPVT